ncbi:MAG: two-component system sensor protein, partial [Aeromicrobium sp.]|nr:two-component system sensor protein [Aeromicrobium sp.]
MIGILRRLNLRHLNIMQLSIRWRITIGTLIVATILTVVAVVAFRAQVERILTTSTTTLLQHDAAPYIAQVASNPNTVAQPGRAQLVAVLDPQGNVIASSMPHSLSKQLAVLLAMTGDTHTVVGGDDLYRVYNEPVVSTAGVWHVITARNEDSAALSLDHITQALSVGAVVIVLSFGLASYLLTAAALRPVTRMRRQAEALAAQGSTQPLPVGRAM